MPLFYLLQVYVIGSNIKFWWATIIMHQLILAENITTTHACVVTDGVISGLVWLYDNLRVHISWRSYCHWWKGIALDCARSDNEVVLLHSRIESNEHTHGELATMELLLEKQFRLFWKPLHFTAPCNGQSWYDWRRDWMCKWWWCSDGYGILNNYNNNG